MMTQGDAGTVTNVLEGEDGEEIEETVPFTFEQCTSVAELVCAADDEPIIRRAKSELILSTQRIEIQMTSSDTVKRLLFPKCIVEEGNSLLPLPTAGIESVTKFDDRSFFPLKIRPEYITMRYSPHRVPDVPVFFPDSKDRHARTGAAEEATLRPPADATAKYEDLLSNLPPEPPAIAAMRSAALLPLPPCSDGDGAGENELALLKSHSHDVTVASSIAVNTITRSADAQIAAPSWLLPSDGDAAPSSSSSSAPSWPASDVNFFQPRSDLRTYAFCPAIKETDPDWILRPYASGPDDPDALKYKDDKSVRSIWLSMPGFSSANAYLLGSLESRCTAGPKSKASSSSSSSGAGAGAGAGADARSIPPPTPGPTLWDVYRPDNDRHHSGMNCFRRDHLRSVLEADLDFTPLQYRQDRADVLTESESDEEDKYEVPPPSLDRVRALVSGNKESSSLLADADGSKGKGDRSVGVSADDAKAWGEQVELLRDRKMLELESSMLKLRNIRAAAFADRLAELSKSSKCLLQALAVQLPFHTYEEEVRNAFEKVLAPVPTSFVEPSPAVGADSPVATRKKKTIGGSAL
jgi:hypothetical protein